MFRKFLRLSASVALLFSLLASSAHAGKAGCYFYTGRFGQIILKNTGVYTDGAGSGYVEVYKNGYYWGGVDAGSSATVGWEGDEIFAVDADGYPAC